MKIGIIGLGNMGKAIVKSFDSNHQIYFVDKNKIKINKAKQVTDIKKLLKSVDVIIISVKPNNFIDIQQVLIENIKYQQIVISIMAGITTEQIKDHTQYLWSNSKK